ncbi:hypothetical protein [Acanthopleuribacter pedis]|uniref:DUF4440 domain-containing protein n=1 Tax=Acanthopleuribacter pedis TaxID=442870 RepID=A0A8J7U5S4_9BACT|nr:hypothetical protein [Acanthopleuribacter pedis]MBO1322863.1 hypothetical protein [Acanthopleuribacter pedis]
MDPKPILDDLVRRFFLAFSRNEQGELDLDVIYDLFIPQGLIIKNVGPKPEIMNVQQFVEPRKTLLGGGGLEAFTEEELWERTEIFGGIAQRFCRYRKAGLLNGTPFQAEGMKTIQFVRAIDGWRMSALSWDDEPS